MEGDRRLRTALAPYAPRLLHEVLDSLDVAVVVLDETSRVLAGNVAASRLVGVRRGRRSGDGPYASVLSVTDEEGRPVDVVDFEAWRTRAALGEPVLLKVLRVDAPARWLSCNALAIEGSVDRGEAIVCTYFDVTARRELERRAAVAQDQAARAEIDLVAAEQRVALLEELLVQLATRHPVPDHG